MQAPTSSTQPLRTVALRTRGQGHGAITRLFSPGDLGERLKPFVFLDRFDTADGGFPGFGMHPHSGIATLTYIAKGSVSYVDTNGTDGIVEAGGVEWMQAGAGAWHGGGPRDASARGFQVWVALSPDFELGPSESLYLAHGDVPVIGPARLLLGEFEDHASPIGHPAPATILYVTLKAGEIWNYTPPQGHETLWLAVATGELDTGICFVRGDFAYFEDGSGPLAIKALDDTEFIIGSASRHPYPLVTGYYSVHSSLDALASGERRILEIRDTLVREGRL